MNASLYGAEHPAAAAPAPAPLAVAHLQRELLTVIRHDYGCMPGAAARQRRAILELRRWIHAIDPAAVLYWTWHGGNDARDDFLAEIARGQGRRLGDGATV